ncbi:MAG: class II fructose-bisphosphate aldolase [Candidatus Pacebacteria bacterium]|nr:class II fructose-bisphosphate aldolase [Candidatus Paceibacterota bacterium]
MKTLREVLADADARHVAVGHFNISDLAALKAIFEGAKELQLPILIGVSEGEREFVGVKQAAALIKNLRETYDYPIFLNADHTHSIDKAKEAAEAGFDEIIFDNSQLPIDENIKNTKEAVAAIRAIDPSIVIEGEIGYIGSSSEIIEARPEASLTLSTPEEAVRFVTETGVDVLAPAVGNMHGLLKSMTTGAADAEHKHLNIERIKEIKAAIANTSAKFMTLHGGSGTEDADFTAAAQAGMTIIHVSSELRLAWRRGVEEGLKDPNEIAPYKIVAPAVPAIKRIVIDRLKLFNP